MLNNIYNKITLELGVHYKEALVHEITGDMKSYLELESITKIATIASTLGIEADIQNMPIKLR